jgi:hypothetical protein
LLKKKHSRQSKSLINQIVDCSPEKNKEKKHKLYIFTENLNIQYIACKNKTGLPMRGL